MNRVNVFCIQRFYAARTTVVAFEMSSLDRLFSRAIETFRRGLVLALTGAILLLVAVARVSLWRMVARRGTPV